MAEKDTLVAWAPRAEGAWQPWRQLVNSVFQSTTSKSTLTPTPLRSCWRNSFIGKGCICPSRWR
jgi:hypothetical protein